MDYKRLKQNFEDRNIEFEYFMDRKALINAVELELENYNTVGIGNSVTLKSLEISKKATVLGKTVFDKTLANNKEEIRVMKKLALTSEIYISSSNAVTFDGKIINVDHSGNRVAAITYGPDRVLIIVGENKLAENEKQGIKRVLEVATPKNANRALIESPCSQGKSCVTCIQEVRVCNYISIIRGQDRKNRMKVLMLAEDIGF